MIVYVESRGCGNILSRNAVCLNPYIGAKLDTILYKYIDILRLVKYFGIVWSADFKHTYPMEYGNIVASFMYVKETDNYTCTIDLTNCSPIKYVFSKGVSNTNYDEVVRVVSELLIIYYKDFLLHAFSRMKVDISSELSKRLYNKDTAIKGVYHSSLGHNIRCSIDYIKDGTFIALRRFDVLFHDGLEININAKVLLDILECLSYVREHIFQSDDEFVRLLSGDLVLEDSDYFSDADVKVLSNIGYKRYKADTIQKWFFNGDAFVYFNNYIGSTQVSFVVGINASLLINKVMGKHFFNGSNYRKLLAELLLDYSDIVKE